MTRIVYTFAQNSPLTDITWMMTSIYKFLDSFQSQDLGEIPGARHGCAWQISARTESLSGSNIEQKYFEHYFVFIITLNICKDLEIVLSNGTRQIVKNKTGAHHQSFFRYCTNRVFCMNHAFLNMKEPKIINFKIKISVIWFLNFVSRKWSATGQLAKFLHLSCQTASQLIFTRFSY